MSILKIYRNRFLLRIIVAYMVVAHGFQILFPTAAYALTSGPTLPSVNNHARSSISQMVDPFTGAFGYNINLMEVGEFPISLNYNASGGMDTEATIVGYNWSLGVGSLNHNVMVTPDDFKGDKIVREFSMRPNTTIGVSGSLNWEVFGKDFTKEIEGATQTIGLNLNLGPSFGVNWNNYRGMGFEFGVNPSFSAANKEKGTLTAGLDLGYSSGSGFNAGLSFAVQQAEKNDSEKVNGNTSPVLRSIGVGANYNSRGGIKNLSLSVSGSIPSLMKYKAEDGEKRRKLRSRSISPSYSFASPTHSAQIDMPFATENFLFNGKGGIALFGTDPTLEISGYVSKQSLYTNRIASSAFGYAYLDKAEEIANTSTNGAVTMDFNRENDGPFIQKVTPYIASIYNGPDTYHATGPGVGGTYRAFRDPGIVYDPFMSTYSNDLSGGIEWGGGATSGKGGLNVKGMVSSSRSGRWDAASRNGLDEVFRFRARGENGDRAQEPYSFKQVGELNFDQDEEYYQRLGDDKAVRVNLYAGPMGFVNKDAYLIDDKDNVYHTTEAQGGYQRSNFTNDPNEADRYHNRVKKNQPMQMLTAEEADKLALEPQIKSYPLNTFNYNSLGIEDPGPNGTFGRMEEERKAHHFSSSILTTSDGRKILYEIPAYNWVQREVSFNASNKEGSLPDPLTVDNSKLVYYHPGSDNSTNNERGIDHYFNATTTPAFAHSYLMTGMLSPGYVDVNNDGITDDDLGQAYQINYSRVHSSFGWRTPLSATPNSASYSKGLEARAMDDKGSYVYGEKEVWYTHSIISRHFIAEFTYSDRNDGHGVVDEDGQINSDKTLKKLDKITLYSKQERINKGDDAVPIKTVHFAYSYELCQQLPNYFEHDTDYLGDPAQSGKLTLKKVWFTYKNSQRGRYNPYVFTYSENNPDYNAKAYDRWGNYKQEDPDLTYWKYPYADQNQNTADYNAEAWLLKSIATPSGGTINVEYEANQYAYVENLKAMQMFKIAGVGSDKSQWVPVNTLYTQSTTAGLKYDNNNLIYIELPEDVTNVDELKKRYFFDEENEMLEELYFSFYMPIEQDKGQTDPDMEQVTGFVKIKEVGLVDPANPTKQAWIEIEESSVKDDNEKDPKVPGVARSAWNFIRNSLPERVFPSDPKQAGTDDAERIRGLVGFAMEMRSVFTGIYRVMADRGFANKVDPSESWVRLYTPYGKKLGGSGARTKRIYTSDAWGEVTGYSDQTNSYGQEFDYTIEEGGETISSGVATFEPMLGMDENPFYQPLHLRKENKWAIDEEYYVTKPIAPSAFRAANVGYRKVKIASLAKENVKSHGTGYTVKEFYTAKEFPTHISTTELIAKGVPAIQFLKKLHTFHATQGFLIKRNDMHGKAWRESIFAEGGEEMISRVEYLYRTAQDFDPTRANELNNTGVKIVKPNGETAEARLGFEMDFVIDERQQETEATGLSTGGNLDGFLAGIFPAFIPMIILANNYQLTQSRFMSATKVINQYGILQKTVVTSGKSCIATENVAYDAESGQVLLTKTTNEFSDDIYNFTYPAYWHYDNMGPSYQNIGIEWQDKQLDDLTDADKYLVPGDVLWLQEGSIVAKAWVLNVNGDEVFAVDKDGIDISTQVPAGHEFDLVKVVESGRQNSQSRAMGSIVTINANPLTHSTPLQAFDKVVTASAIEYSDQWQMQCGTSQVEDECYCEELTQEAIDLQTLLQAIAQDGLLINETFNLMGYPNEYLNSSLLTALTPDVDPLTGLNASNCSVEFRSTAQATSNNCTEVLDIQIGYNCSGSFTPVANIQLDVDEGSNPILLCLDYMTEFSTIEADLSNAGECTDVNEFSMLGHLPYCIGEEDVFPLRGTIDAFPIRDCETIPVTKFACAEPGDVVNPFRRGIRGNWRPLKSYTYLTGRTVNTASATPNVPAPYMDTDIRNEGILTDFTPFWKLATGQWSINNQIDKWQWTAEATKYVPQGQEVESKNPLDIYSAAVFGHQGQVPIVTTNNARNYDIAFANFEVKEDVSTYCQSPVSIENSGPNLNGDYAHTGKQSLVINPGFPAASPIILRADMGSDLECTPSNLTNSQYTVDDCDCAGNFRATWDKKYLMTFWVYGDAYHMGQVSNSPIDDYNGLEVNISVGGISYPVTPSPLKKGSLLDGWQRYELSFELPTEAAFNAANVQGSAALFEIKFENSGTQNLYLDDLVVQPYLSGIKTFVYDPVTLRLMAAMDNNGYATFYKYNKAGDLIGVQKETKEGIQSLNETRQSVKPQVN
ncbi:MAG: hypothetical protein AAF927_17150 [Bacteroidota bacterium]